MALKILLVLPIREGDNFKIAPDLGLLYVGTVLRNKGFDVTLLDCPKEKFTFKDFKAFLREENYDVVGFRCYSRDHNYVNHHLNIVRQVNPSALTLTGGPHPSALPEFVLSSMPSLDFAWKAEAEEGLPELLSCFAEYGRDIPENLLEKVPGLAWRNEKAGQAVVNQPSFGMDLDSYGIPAWDLAQPETYPGFTWDEYYPILTTRGCPYPCTYCNTPGLSGRKLRHRSVEHVIEELSLLKSRYGVRRFSIIDDEFTLNKKYATRFSEALIESNLNLKWDCPVGVRLDSLNPDLLKVMEAAGCENLAVGIESGNERVQKLIKKRVTVEKIREKAAMIADCSDIRIVGYFMIGFLDETEEEIRDTIRLASQLRLRRANFNIVIPIPGTAIFDELLEHGLIKLEDINWDTLTSDQVAFERRHVSGRRLLRLQQYAYLRFYGNPRIIWDLTQEVLSNREVFWTSLRKVKMLSWRGETYSFTPMYLREKFV
ncbi:B12-binding domain-containing radical SAM protein [Acidobacteria bacterium AH-259-D05]|nr:B12-binding domain-containing radical SAM protein [Acidobacteria bacterium AH-259-D05]